METSEWENQVYKDNRTNRCCKRTYTMKPKPMELIRIAKQVKKAIGPFYSFALIVDKQIRDIPFYIDVANIIYDLVMSFDEIKDKIMTAFGVESVKYRIQISEINPYFVVKEIIKRTLDLIRMADSILSKTSSKYTRLPTRKDLLDAYFRLEQQVVLLIVWLNSYLNHVYN